VASTSIDGALWRIAELGSRYSDPSWPGNRRRIWEALESTIAEVLAELGEVDAALKAAQAQAMEAEARSRAARRERDRLRARASALETAVKEARASNQGHEIEETGMGAARQSELQALRRARREWSSPEPLAS